jgi:HAD superfamily hydrolase (TIGR01509 family)
MQKKIKAIIFDLDGVLVDSCDMHFEAFNKALIECGFSDKQLSYQEHLSIYNGKSTRDKLNILETKKGLHKKFHDIVHNTKQNITRKSIELYKHDIRIIDILKQLKKDGYTIYCASNSIWYTIKTILLKKGFLDYIDYFISNEDVKFKKPHPEIYYKCLERLDLNPKQVLIVEDSNIGFQSALSSGANVLRVKNTYDVTYENISSKIKELTPRLNIVIPMAGNGSRFTKAGYTLPKPLIKVNEKAMIQLVVENLSFDYENTNFIFICQKEHREKYDLDSFLSSIVPGCHIISVDKITRGAACTVLLSKEFINNDDNLIIANSDQFLEWDACEFLKVAHLSDVDCMISTFEDIDPKWSFVKEKNGYVTEVAEKIPISNKATTGVYYWKNGSEFVNCAEGMISKNIMFNNEFYVSPVFNEAIIKNKKITTFDCIKMWGLGIPEDLQVYLESHSN